MLKDSIRAITLFFFETGMLARTPRAGFQFLGTGKQNVAEHTNRVGYIVYALGKLDGTVNIGRMLEMALFHDVAEARISDLGYVHQKYVTKDEHAAVRDMTVALPFGADIVETLREYEARESRESVLVKEADNLELLLRVKEEIDNGNTRAQSWLPPIVARLQTGTAKELADMILKTNSDAWWYGDVHDDWWVNRNKS